MELEAKKYHGGLVREDKLGLKKTGTYAGSESEQRYGRDPMNHAYSQKTKNASDIRRRRHRCLCWDKVPTSRFDWPRAAESINGFKPQAAGLATARHEETDWRVETFARRVERKGAY